MTNINYTDLVNIKAISIKGTQLKEILEYWDAVDRSYPSYIEFNKSINKLESLNAIKINKIGSNWQISNVLYKHMSFLEKIRYFLNPNNKFLVKILSRLNENCNAIDIKITEEDYELAFNKIL
ncbi:MULTISPECIES: hypothetical protein [unclassified Flavobacterium]|uniref:hypothetical protein n=1 Tax=unclassified Flavobacterium TaxID=196869 RepID=UPI001291E1BF|nr:MULTISPECIES: hypothetical protein [unclassified Flavobacterium]MQP51800.1 hypothetical protein [Flavobacterium sp. LMO9]MQP61669.1 hypothetical protein [Flavobacterium sp. LMO6]